MFFLALSKVKKSLGAVSKNFVFDRLFGLVVNISDY